MLIKNIVTPLARLALLLAALTLSSGAYAQVALNLSAGWNLLGNNSSTMIEVATTFADPTKITTVWKWNKTASKWAFYAPSMTPSALTTYAQGKGYDVLTAIEQKEGYWVNASTPVAVALIGPVPIGMGMTLFERDLQPGWNLVASDDNKTPSQLNQSLKCSLNAAGKAIVTAWAWDAPNNNWKFFAPALEAQGGSALADYITGKAYLPFSTALSAAEGFWLNIGTASGGSTVARIEIQQTGLLLTQAGDTRQLAAAAYDALGNVLNVPITWSSTKPADISVDNTGKVTAVTANGSGQIVADVNCVKSAPLLVVVTQPVANAILLTDAQIVGNPVETDPNAPPSFNNTYQVVLTGVSAPAIGSILISTESKAVAGRVVAVNTAVGQTIVTLQLVSVPELLPDLNVNETIDLSRAPVTFPADVVAAYDIQRTGNTFTFTPKSTPVSTNLRGAVVTPTALTAFTAPSFFDKCEASFTGPALSTSPFQLSKLPTPSFTLSPTVDFVYTKGIGFERLMVYATPKLTMEAALTVTAAFEGKITCEKELGAIIIPITGGALDVIAGGQVPFGYRIELGGKLTLANMSLSVKNETSATVQIGLACPGAANCTFVHNLGPVDNTLTPSLTLPSLANLRVEPSLKAYGYLKAVLGMPAFESMRFETFEATAGSKFQGSFAPEITQILDTTYKSDYKVSLEATAKVGVNLGDALKLFGIENINALDQTISTNIAKSPAGTVSADKSSFASGDTVNFTVRLDPGTTDFFPLLGPYNVDKILLVRRYPGLDSTSVVGTAVAASGQTDFNITYAAPDSGSVGEFSAFVVTRLLPLDFLALELGQANDVTPYSVQVTSASCSAQFDYPQPDGYVVSGARQLMISGVAKGPVGTAVFTDLTFTNNPTPYPNLSYLYEAASKKMTTCGNWTSFVQGTPYQGTPISGVSYSWCARGANDPDTTSFIHSSVILVGLVNTVTGANATVYDLTSAAFPLSCP
jgi:hypothetical protein